jgi:hypothetical protein
MHPKKCSFTLQRFRENSGSHKGSTDILILKTTGVKKGAQMLSIQPNKEQETLHKLLDKRDYYGC